MNIRYRLITLSVLMLLMACTRQPTSGLGNTEPSQSLAGSFQNPPDETKPWLYWYWINNHISEEGITRDLEAMADVGIGAALIGNIYLDRVKEDGPVPMLSPEWKRLTQHAIREGGRLGVDIGMFNSPGWSQSGGPWNTTDNSMRFLASRETQVTGPLTFNEILPAPVGDFADVAVLAFPSTPTGEDILIEATNFTSKDTAVLNFSAPASAPALYTTLLLKPEGTFFATVVLRAEIKGEWQTLRTFRFDRSNNMDQIGFYDDPPLTISFPATEARKFRLEFTKIKATRGSKKIGLKTAALSTSARLEYGLEKQLALMHPTPLPLEGAYQWPAQAEPTPEQVVPVGQVIDLSDKLDEDGVLNWEVPPGNWTIVRTGMLSTGVKNGPAAPGATGLEVDKMNRGALPQHFDAFIGDLLNSMPASEREAFKYVIADSYEMGGQNWTDDLEGPFKKNYGYDPLPWLPVLSGHVVSSVDESNRFLWDLRRLVADRVAYEYVGGLRDMCAENGLKLWLENYGHWGFPSEFLLYGGQSDFVGGEFWNEGTLGSIECKAAASAAHIYGKEQVSAESFTAAGKDFERYPAMLKKKGDWSFTEGINHRVYHVYIQQPYEDKQPGVNAWFGTEFNRHNTWFPKAKSWIDYERRCGYLLRQGEFVADVAYFIGEDVPKMTGVTDPPVPPGYSFDYINADVLHNRTSVVDGRITVADGPSYRILVLPKSETMRPEMLLRIAELVAEGATIVGAPPRRSPSLTDFGVADENVTETAEALWQNERVVNDTSLQNILLKIGTVADLELPPNSPVLWIHRRTSDQEIYFLTNQSEETIDFVAGFRAKGLRPEWWDPIDGAHRPLPEFRGTAEHVHVPLRLGPLESGFVVFSEPDGAAPTGKNYPQPKVLTELAGSWSVQFRNDYLGMDKTIELENLMDWSGHADEDIRYFSGSATYRKTFAAPKVPAGQEVWLELGDVAVVANVTVNGRYVGGLWTAPWRIEVSDYLIKGNNEIAIEVTNLWVNQLIEDAELPEGEQRLWTLTGVRPKRKELQPSGLLGPVRLVTNE
ncbi:glycosyl hydrolase [Neolewinella antarctica]|uniref:Beta-mannosidase-like galactose-binding domain-containing protein n=1 Tax=Neolewinella antarctica TaxID=442734 RepID=A0ABX0XGK5_9BACT|nr:glycosyl hydrolase [Neolewinella antarctica]NJC28327.1 hypothetical protein [Neolewinella antarctica]